MARRASLGRLGLVLSVIAVMAGTPTIARSTEEVVFSVIEPIATPNYIGLADVPCIMYVGGWRPACEVTLMEKANCVRIEGNDQGQNRNVVSLCGIGVRVQEDPRWAFISWKEADSVDTVTVIVDCRQVQESPLITAGVSEIVDATVECVITNATRSKPLIRNLRLVVQGPGKGASTKVLRLSDLPTMPRKRVFE
jgi:hypothetical protein